jgi:carbamoyltransferase
VDRVRHPFLHDVLRKFDEMTGCAVVVNTSFNVRGEPIVNTAEDAVECFIATDIDILVLDNHVIVRSEQPDGVLTPRRASALGKD